MLWAALLNTSFPLGVFSKAVEGNTWCRPFIVEKFRISITRLVRIFMKTPSVGTISSSNKSTVLAKCAEIKKFCKSITKLVTIPTKTPATGTLNPAKRTIVLPKCLGIQLCKVITRFLGILKKTR